MNARQKPHAAGTLAGAAIAFLPMTALRPDPRNSRKHSEAQVYEIVASMGEFGWTIPILADMDDDGLIAAGHGRLMAAEQVYAAGGLIQWVDGTDIPDGHVPVIDCSNWTPEQRRKYVIADNRLAEKSEWDLDMLRVELEDLDLLDADDDALRSIGFTADELDGFFPAISTAGLTDPDETPEVEATAISEPGDIWLLGDHRVICGDATDAAVVARLLDGARPNLMATDPPYGVEYDPSWRAKVGVSKNTKKMGKVLNDDRADWREAWALFPGDVAYVWHASLFTREVLNSLEAVGFELRSHIVWAKDRFVLGRRNYHWQHEPCWYVVRSGKKANWVGGRSQSTLWNIPARDDGGHGHGTQKPVECMLRPIMNNTRRGDAVYDPFCGSGTTVIAAEKSGRRAFAVELNPAYVDVIVRRWQVFAGKHAILDGDGRTFDEISAVRGK